MNYGFFKMSPSFVATSFSSAWFPLPPDCEVKEDLHFLQKKTITKEAGKRLRSTCQEGTMPSNSTNPTIVKIAKGVERSSDSSFAVAHL